MITSRYAPKHISRHGCSQACYYSQPHHMMLSHICSFIIISAPSMCLWNTVQCSGSEGRSSYCRSCNSKGDFIPDRKQNTQHLI